MSFVCAYVRTHAHDGARHKKGSTKKGTPFIF